LTQAEVAEMLEALEEKDHRGLSPSDVAITPRDLAAPANVVSPVVPIHLWKRLYERARRARRGLHRKSHTELIRINSQLIFFLQVDL